MWWQESAYSPKEKKAYFGKTPNNTGHRAASFNQFLSWYILKFHIMRVFEFVLLFFLTFVVSRNYIFFFFNNNYIIMAELFCPVASILKNSGY